MRDYINQSSFWWWACGGFLTGTVTILAITLIVFLARA
jgi:hypothetical protein